jgi:UDP:flavonoid glycosyltransferase YjiC (YdhE family)
MILPEWISSSRIVLVAPLNWGLGHATRCIPIIQYLIENGKRVIIASDGDALQLLKEEFPDLIHHEIPGYDIHYKYPSMVANMLLQSWKMITRVKAERKATHQLVLKHNVDTILSDNRYGVRDPSCKNVIICHQINILHPIKAFAKMASAINHRWINQFHECWIPDFPPPQGISGELSRAQKLHHSRFIEVLTRFKPMDMPIDRDILVILSGPEPSRSRLENILLKTLDGMDYLMIRGVPSAQIPGHPNLQNFMTAHELNRAICSSRVVICRSGYTSLMDLIKLKKKAVLIPTPGQVEQEYLARLAEKRYNSYFNVLKESETAGQLIQQLTETLSTI